MHTGLEVGSGRGANRLRSVPVLIVNAVAVTGDARQLGCRGHGEQTHRS